MKFKKGDIVDYMPYDYKRYHEKGLVGVVTKYVRGEKLYLIRDINVSVSNWLCNGGNLILIKRFSFWEKLKNFLNQRRIKMADYSDLVFIVGLALCLILFFAFKR